MIFHPHAYQRRAVDFVIEHEACGLFMDMGLGKTVCTLTAVERLMNDYLSVSRALVVAPKSVALNTWSDEASKWSHLTKLRMSIVMGTASQRVKALTSDADIYVINRDNMQWLVNECVDRRKAWPFDMVIIDESSSFKNWQSKRFRSLFRVRPLIHRMVLLTGTPAPNGLMDLWAQVKLLDKGERLGKHITAFRQRYFHPGAHNGAVVYDWLPNTGAKEQITEKISDICLSMQTQDYLEMPMVIDGGMTITLPEWDAYKQFEKQNVLPLADGSEIEAVTAVALTNKLLQFSSGAVYDDEHHYHCVSGAKLDALSDLLEQTDEPVLIFYNYQHERQRIMDLCPGAVCFKGEPDLLKQWNDRTVKVMLCHPASVGYGLNLQKGGHIIVWFSPTWNLELYQQANARLNRQGQEKPVVIYHLVCRGTMDEVVMSALKNKSDTQNAVMKYLKHLLRNEKTS